MEGHVAHILSSLYGGGHSLLIADDFKEPRYHVATIIELIVASTV